ncbi:MAG: DsbA family protein [Gemmatimonas sp.]
MKRPFARPLSFLIALGVVAVFAVIGSARLMPGVDSSAAFDNRVRDYIMRHPEVVLESVTRLQAEQIPQPAAAADPRDAIAMNQDRLYDDATSQVAGNPNGDVTIVLFFDYRCPFCKQGVAQEKAFLAADGNARIVYKEFPILGAPSVRASRAALASIRQHKYLPFHDAMMAHRGDFSDSEIFGMAMQVGIDIERLRADMDAPEITEILRANFALAQSLKVDGTPAYVIGDRMVSGITSAAQFQAMADELRAKARQAQVDRATN